jgi:hypothetical protein
VRAGLAIARVDHVRLSLFAGVLLFRAALGPLREVRTKGNWALAAVEQALGLLKPSEPL